MCTLELDVCFANLPQCVDDVEDRWLETVRICCDHTSAFAEQVFACVELEDETARADALAVFAHVRNGTDDSEHTADNSYLRRIVPKSADRQADLLLCVFDHQSATFHMQHSTLVPCRSWTIEWVLIDDDLSRCQLRARVHDAVDMIRAHQWLREHMLPKTTKWLSNVVGDVHAQADKLRSLSLINVEHIVRCTEHTFVVVACKCTASVEERRQVHEELFARFDSKLKPSFVDLGCGNGLLVYLLTCEQAIDPDTAELGQSSTTNTWLIGNHSDELTAWIPVMAGRKACHFCVLPCCAFDLFGKFADRANATSKYSSYCDFVQNQAERIGCFDVRRDRMRIPSTKAICIIGVHSKSDQLTINACCAQIVSDARTAADQRPFVARSAEIAITNCTRIPDDVKASLVAKIVSYLLLDEAVSMEWRRGRAATIAQLAASALSDGDKLHLKSQGNGIATFVRNHAHVFTLERNKVTLRDYRHRPMTATAPARMCWFNAHHPDGCPLAAKCTLQHL